MSRGEAWACGLRPGSVRPAVARTGRGAPSWRCRRRPDADTGPCRRDSSPTAAHRRGRRVPRSLVPESAQGRAGPHGEERAQEGIDFTPVGADTGPIDGAAVAGVAAPILGELLVAAGDVVLGLVVVKHGVVPRLTEELQQLAQRGVGVEDEVLVAHFGVPVIR